jgi:hypothetical protein
MYDVSRFFRDSQKQQKCHQLLLLWKSTRNILHIKFWTGTDTYWQEDASEPQIHHPHSHRHRELSNIYKSLQNLETLFLWPVWTEDTLATPLLLLLPESHDYSSNMSSTIEKPAKKVFQCFANTPIPSDSHLIYRADPLCKQNTSILCYITKKTNHKTSVSLMTQQIRQD